MNVKPQVYVHRVMVRFDDETMELLTAAAAFHGESVSETIRQAVNEALSFWREEE